MNRCKLASLALATKLAWLALALRLASQQSWLPIVMEGFWVGPESDALSVELLYSQVEGEEEEEEEKFTDVGDLSVWSRLGLYIAHSIMSHPTDEELGKDMDIKSMAATSEFHSENLPFVHKVGVPPNQNFFKEFGDTLKETFFADDPLRPFKDQTRSRKFVLGLQTVFPILQWCTEYNFTKFKGDLIAGLTIAILCIPQDIGYAKLANLKPQYGLYTSFVPPLIYAFMGSSRDMAIGPVAVVSLLLGTLLQNEIDPVKEPYQYLRLAYTATFFAGITQFILGFFRLGFLIDFLSHAAIVGFMAGAAITIALQQLKGLLGIKNFTRKTDIVSVMRSVWSTVDSEWSWPTILIGITFLALLLVSRYIGKKNKKLFWVPAIAPLFSVIVGTIPRGINPSSVHEIFFNGSNVLTGFRIGVVAGMIALTEAIAIGRTFAGMKDYQLDGNKEMVALGTMNIVGSMTSCYVATGSFSRSAVNCMAGCHTAVSNIVMSCVVLITLELITPLFSSPLMPSSHRSLYLQWCQYHLLRFCCVVTRPRTALLGKLPRTIVYRNIKQYPEATKVPGVLIVRVDSAVYFSNSNYVRERILRWLADEEEQLKETAQPQIQYLIVEMSPVTDIDTSGIHAFEELYRSLQKREIQLALANPGAVVMSKLYASNFPNLIGEDKIFLTVADAVRSCAPKMEEP
ncbi:SLC26A/SulP transporter domain [Dillenia turbinata]|uniref:SLC26A/SulP transporter domain n=1 Tax=Dillenia turbinata TaxID=194707 RepID=A0AAN8URD4_9MAGN